MEPKKKIQLLPGVKYPGYAIPNEFGEFTFYPSQIGSRQGRVKALKKTDNYDVSYTNHNILIHMKIERKHSFKERLRELMSIVNEVISIFREYEI